MRRSGILMHISSLPSKHGIGTFGKEAFAFCDFLAAAGQTIWQVLPLGPTGFGDSPYQSFSTYAGNPYFIDLDLLADDGLLDPADYEDLGWAQDPLAVDYETLYHLRFPVLRKAWQRYQERDTTRFDTFYRDQSKWLKPYALFMALKNSFGGLGWQEWPEPFKHGDADVLAIAADELAGEIRFQSFLQYLFWRQWQEVKQYANERGILIMGDMPIYVAPDSSDVWSEPQLFDLDLTLAQRTLAGYPPDAFSDDGQLWGNPLYRWDVMAQDGYRWWIDRLRAACEQVDFLRLDHFIGFEEYYCIPADSENARVGEWKKGPGLALFNEAKEALGELPLIAEDLGNLTPQVRKLLADVGFPGMKVLEFAFGEDDSEHMPHNHIRNLFLYAGTHDNPTIAEWFEGLPAEERARCIQYTGLYQSEDIVWHLLRTLQASVADHVVMQMQDVLGLGVGSRMNVPGTLGDNWRWRMEKDALTPDLAKRLRALTKLYAR
ncbi:MAG: 4-alpha-glucanotransferase [Clostridiales bacterium]|nr:4-alpha-glucanotransferase [Clostridiales bacterium]